MCRMKVAVNILMVLVLWSGSVSNPQSGLQVSWLVCYNHCILKPFNICNRNCSVVWGAGKYKKRAFEQFL
jgi:hypothetical protein